MPLPHEDFKVFISHATYPDSDLAIWLAEGFDRVHIRAFVYESYQIGGQNRFKIVRDMIAVCPWFIAVLTKSGIASQWVNQEIGYASALNRFIIPIVEVDQADNKMLHSKGFVELHDPVPYLPGQNYALAQPLFYTLVETAKSSGNWSDLVFLSCKCGTETDYSLGYDRAWDYLHKTRQPFVIRFNCINCGQPIQLSFPDCHLVQS